MQLRSSFYPVPFVMTQYVESLITELRELNSLESLPTVSQIVRMEEIEEELERIGSPL